jgi:5-(carboxyamino)imidazole ribonucleotide synthase
VNEAERWLTVPGAAVHLYGKGAPSPGRKMGHVTRVWPGK